MTNWGVCTCISVFWCTWTDLRYFSSVFCSFLFLKKFLETDTQFDQTIPMPASSNLPFINCWICSDFSLLSKTKIPYLIATWSPIYFCKVTLEASHFSFLKYQVRIIIALGGRIKLMFIQYHEGWEAFFIQSKVLGHMIVITQTAVLDYR